MRGPELTSPLRRRDPCNRQVFAIGQGAAPKNPAGFVPCRGGAGGRGAFGQGPRAVPALTFAPCAGVSARCGIRP